MSAQLYLAYVAACFAIVIVPGPTVTLIIANCLRHGARAGLFNVAGTQLGLALMIAILCVGLASIIAGIGVWFDWVRLAGAAYLVWLGWKLLRAPAALAEPGHAAATPPGRWCCWARPSWWWRRCAMEPTRCWSAGWGWRCPAAGFAWPRA